MHKPRYCLREGELGLPIAVSAGCYLFLPAAVTGRTPACPYLLDLKHKLPPFYFLKKELCCGRKEKLFWGAEQRRGEENLAAWIARSALSGFMTPAA